MISTPTLPPETSDAYETRAYAELERWREEMLRGPGLWSRATRGLQRRVNSYIPEKVHTAVTAVIRQMTQAVLSGSSYIGAAPLQQGDLQTREQLALAKIDRYRKTAAVEGGVTGAGGFLLGLADFPALIGIKLNLLFELAALYGHSGEDYRERMYMLYVFQLAFSGDAHRRTVYLRLADWRERRERLPATLDDFDWRTFQQEYRDYIDLAKLAQLLPVVGAPVGFVVNNRLVRRLGVYAMNAYRMRWFEERIGVEEREPE
jgi:EcsC protein family